MFSLVNVIGMWLWDFMQMLLIFLYVVIKELIVEKEGGIGKVCLEQMVVNKDLLKEGWENVEVLLFLICDRLLLEVQMGV